MFGVMALVFLLTRLPEELDGTGGQVEAEQLRRTCRGTPLEGEVDSLIERGHVGVLDADDIRVLGYERANLLLVMVIVQAVQVLVLANLR
jgi:hypothetical protein